MRVKREHLAGLVGIILLAGVTSPALGYDYNGQPWCVLPVDYYVNPEEPPLICPPSTSTLLAEVNAAAATWNAAGTGFQLDYLGTTTLRGCVPDGTGKCVSNHDGNNVVSLSQSCTFDANVLATAWWWYNTVTCCIEEADVCFNRDIYWLVGGACAGQPPPDCYDLQSVALHELGHWISLGHENHDAILSYKPVMYWPFSPCERRRLLTCDDIRGVEYAYPFPAGGAVVPPAGGRCVPVHNHIYPPCFVPTLRTVGMIALVSTLAVVGWLSIRRRTRLRVVPE